MGSTPRYLLLVACSQRKHLCSGPAPALELYDGVSFRVLRKAQREGHCPENLDVLILSAKYGLLEPSTLVETYDLKMTQQRALELQEQVCRDLDMRLGETSYTKVFVNLGKTYMVALSSSKELLALQGRAQYAAGGIGERMSQMKAWLHSLD